MNMLLNGQLGIRPAFYLNAALIELYYGKGTAGSPYSIVPPPTSTKWAGIPAEAAAVRILIAHSGETLESQDLDEIMRYSWNGYPIKPDTRITSHPLETDAST